MINLILTAIVLAVPVYMASSVIYIYLSAPGTQWERIKTAFHDSVTVAWARLTALSATLVGLVGEVSGYAGAPGVQQAIEPYLQPKYMLAYMLVVTIGAEIARRRTLP